MKTLQEIENSIMQVIRLVEADKQSEIRLNANGGNSILLVCPPQQEKDFIETLQKMLDKNNFNIIDLNALLIDYIDKNRESLEEAFDLLQSSLHQIFKVPDAEYGNDDFYNYILNAIKICFNEKKIPVLIRTGTLYGTGIENIHLVENDLIMNSQIPIIVLYPAEEVGEKLMFLNSRPSSKYRCMIIK